MKRRKKELANSSEELANLEKGLATSFPELANSSKELGDSLEKLGNSSVDSEAAQSVCGTAPMGRRNARASKTRLVHTNSLVAL